MRNLEVARRPAAKVFSIWETRTEAMTEALLEETSLSDYFAPHIVDCLSRLVKLSTQIKIYNGLRF